MDERAVQARQQMAQSRVARVGRRRSAKHASDTWIATEGGPPRMESNLTRSYFVSPPNKLSDFVGSVLCCFL